MFNSTSSQLPGRCAPVGSWAPAFAGPMAEENDIAIAWQNWTCTASQRMTRGMQRHNRCPFGQSHRRVTTVHLKIWFANFATLSDTFDDFLQTCLKIVCHNQAGGAGQNISANWTWFLTLGWPLDSNQCCKLWIPSFMHSLKGRWNAHRCLFDLKPTRGYRSK